MWCDWGRTMEIGLETECPAYQNIVFRDCHVIRGGNTSTLGQPSYAGVNRVRVKNIAIYADSQVMSRTDGRCVTVKIRNLIPATEYSDIEIENVSLNEKRISADGMSILIEGCDRSVLTVK